jgi:ADP-ribose pyrophosphatase YjhB (NUDIX family)
MGFIDFVRGKFPDDDDDDDADDADNENAEEKDNGNIKLKSREEILKTYFEEMTCEERRKLSQEGFKELWDTLWINKLSMLYLNEYIEAERKFATVDIKKMLENTECKWTEQEYGFPKGRKNMYESNFECAKREFKEESGYTSDQIRIYQDRVWEENFTGTNGVVYKHVYYLAEILPHVTSPKIPLEDVRLAGEISSMGWFTFSECCKKIRPYDEAKKQLLTDINRGLVSML